MILARDYRDIAPDNSRTCSFLLSSLHLSSHRYEGLLSPGHRRALPKVTGLVVTTLEYYQPSTAASALTRHELPTLSLHEQTTTIKSPSQSTRRFHHQSKKVATEQHESNQVIEARGTAKPEAQGHSDVVPSMPLIDRTLPPICALNYLFSPDYAHQYYLAMRKR